MKRNITPLLLLAAAGLFAQPNIQQLSLNVGDALVLDVVFPITDAGAGGANAVWDFSGSFSGVEFPYTAVATAGTQYADSFPMASSTLFMDGTSGFSGYYYFDLNDGFTEHGDVFIEGIGVDHAVYTNPLTLFTTPLSVSSAGSDSYAKTSYTFWTPVYTSGSHVWSVDGYGTLILPNATYTDVLRIHSVQNVETVVGPFTTPSTIEEWRWVKAGIPFPLLTFGLETEDEETEVSAQSALISFTGATGISELPELPIRVFPNPASDVLTLELEARGKVQYRVLDALGREVLEGTIGASGTLRHSISVAVLNAGLYQLEVRSADGMATESLIIE